MDIHVSYPRPGRIDFSSDALFSRADDAPCREFLTRAIQAAPVESVVISTSQRTAVLHYNPRKVPPEEAIAAVFQSLNEMQPVASQVSEPSYPKEKRLLLSRKRGKHAKQDRLSKIFELTLPHDKERRGPKHPKKMFLKSDDSGFVRVFKYGTLISTWEISHFIPGRMRLRNSILFRRSDLCQTIERELMSVLGVTNYKTNPLTCSVLIYYDENQITRMQVIEILQSAIDHGNVNGETDRLQTEFALTTFSVPLAITAQFAVPALLPVSAALFAYTSIPTFKGAYHVLTKEKRLGVDVLDAIVVTSCLATASVFAGAMLCWCLSFGRLLVRKTEDHSKRMLQSVFGKQVKYVCLYKDGAEIVTPLEEIEKGDIIVVNTGEAVPVDGVIHEGISMIDQHALTGESQPAEKVVGDKVFASTMVIAGRILVEVEQAGGETASAKIAQILSDTAGYKLGSQHRGEQLADKAVIPTLCLGAIGLGVIGPFGATAVLNSDFGTGIRMAAPLGMLSSLALCAQNGILVKDGRALDLMHGIDTILFDKTGTLTKEVPEVGQVVSCGVYDPDDLLMWAAAAENKMSHPIARAIVMKFEELKRPMPTIAESEYAIGFGITVNVDGRKIRVGSARFMDMEKIEIPPQIREMLAIAHEEGHSLIMIGVDDKLGGVVELRTSKRPEIEGIIAGLRARGIKHLAIISGDHDGPTRKLAESLGMDEYFANVLPSDKARYVEELQKRGRKVCFVGDGINDSIALKKANVSISLRGATSIATDTAQVVFMEESLAKLCDLIDIAHKLDQNVKRSWGLIILPNALCIAGAFTLGFGILASVFTNNVASIAALANGVLPLREVARLQAKQEREQMTRITSTTF